MAEGFGLWYHFNCHIGAFLLERSTNVFGEPDGDKIVQKGVYAKMARE